MIREYDAIVVGGGPAGSTTAAVLAERGRRVLVLERDKFPRYHVGESLIPYTYFPLARLGLIERMKASHFPKKYSVQFVSMDGRASQPFYFSQHFQHEAACTWQVLRSDFDRMLLDNAREKGAEVRHEVCVKGFLESNGTVTGVRAVSAHGGTEEIHAPITLDATGRDALALARNGWRVRDPYLNKIALWTYYSGAVRDPGIDEGATTVAYLPEKGWFWYIPLPDDMVSVGIVAEKEYLFRDTRDLAQIFHREVARNRWIESHLEPGSQFGPFQITGEFSYRSRHCATDGLVLVGDAFAFLDPVFSSGVFLALTSGELAGDAVDAALSAGDVSAARFTGYGAKFREGLEAMRRLVYGFYDNEFNFRDFLSAHPNFKGDLTDCLIGNVYRDFEPMYEAMARFARIPEPLPHGMPLIRG
ncbi:MAG: tryptophan 7-halogenase [Bryobacterales bacterium]|nr:tryptophan 7-halogenase [Bryobacterales bacterium]